MPLGLWQRMLTGGNVPCWIVWTHPSGCLCTRLPSRSSSVCYAGLFAGLCSGLPAASLRSTSVPCSALSGVCRSCATCVLLVIEAGVNNCKEAGGPVSLFLCAHGCYCSWRCKSSIDPSGGTISQRARVLSVGSNAMCLFRLLFTQKGYSLVERRELGYHSGAVLACVQTNDAFKNPDC